MTRLEYDQSKRDIARAADIIRRGLSTYRKQKIGARNKKQLEEVETLFADLSGFGSTDEINDAYGYGYITDTHRAALLRLWDARENYRRNAGRYTDGVTALLEKAIDGCLSKETDEAFYLFEQEDSNEH